MRPFRQDASDHAALRLLTSAACSRLTCPSNDRIAAEIGARGAGAGAAALKRLERAGHIKVEREAGWRVVTITELGSRTEGEDA